MGKLIDLTGQRFGRLTVLHRVLPNKDGPAVWRCHCDCGKETDVVSSSLKNGHTKSCGCIRAESIKSIATIHGKRQTRLYRIWLSMKNRCNNPNYHHYDRYGGRGIVVCDKWQSNFQAFWEWAMANGYQDDLSIDRIDNDKGYSPDNCRWATAKEQANNLSSNRMIHFGSETHNLAQWSEIQKLSINTVNYRLRAGWTIEEALNLVPRKK